MTVAAGPPDDPQPPPVEAEGVGENFGSVPEVNTMPDLDIAALAFEDDAEPDGMAGEQPSGSDDRPELISASSEPAASATRHDDSARSAAQQLASAALPTFSKWTPFLDLHYRAGHADAHPTRERICFATDWIVRLIAVLLVFAVVAAIIFKTIS